MLLAWLSQNWVDLMETLMVVLAIVSIRQNTKTRRLANLLIITGNHRELWKQTTQNKALAQVLQTPRNMVKFPLRREEETFLNDLILNFKTGFELMKDLPMIEKRAVSEDVKQLFCLPAPRAFWEKVKPFYPKQFRDFVDQYRSLDGL